MHLHFRVPIKIPVTLSEHWISHSARFKNTMIEILKTSTDPQVPKGVDALKQLLFLKKRRIQFPVVVPASKIACALNPRSWSGWNRHLVNSAAPRGQHVVKCVFNPRIVAALNPHYLPPCCGGWGAFESHSSVWTLSSPDEYFNRFPPFWQRGNRDKSVCDKLVTITLFGICRSICLLILIIIHQTHYENLIDREHSINSQ